LALAVSAVCQEAHASVLWDELRALRQRISGFQRLGSHGIPPAREANRQTVSPDKDGNGTDRGTIVDRALDYLRRHYTDANLSLTAVAAALGCNANYLTERFTQLVGQRMHSYIVSLRVDRAGRELLRTDLPIKQIALESGFQDPSGLSRVFHRQVGVSPSEYRRIFAGR
jgi:AraC family transcriptional regulator